MHRRLHLAAAPLLLIGAVAPAQIHSPQVSIHRHHAEQDLSWLWQYTEPAGGSRENALLWDPHFKPFLQRNLTAPQSFWNASAKQNIPLSDVAMNFLGVPGDVLGENDRYVTADGCVPHFCPDRGLLWVDLGLPKPLVVFAAIDWITENRATEDKNATYTLWLFPNQPVDPSLIPGALIRSIRRWTSKPSSGATELQNITRVFLVDPDGTPHTLAPSAIGAHNSLPPETSNDSSTPSTPNQHGAPKARP